MNDILMFPSRLKYRIFREPVDFRNGMNGLSKLVYKHLGKGIEGEPIMFFFFNRTRKEVKALWFDNNRIHIYQCRLGDESFTLPVIDPSKKTLDIEPAKMMALLQGLRLYKIEPSSDC